MFDKVPTIQLLYKLYHEVCSESSGQRSSTCCQLLMALSEIVKLANSKNNISPSLSSDFYSEPPKLESMSRKEYIVIFMVSKTLSILRTEHWRSKWVQFPHTNLVVSLR